MDDEFFAENCLVEINVPEHPELDIEATLSAPEPDNDENTASLVPSIPQRSSLYFDETLPIYVVIRVPREDESAFRARILRLSVNIEAHVQNDPSQPPPKDGVPPADVIWSGKLNPREEPIVVMEESAEEEDLPTALLLWKTTATLNRPRLRIPSPVISWVVTATLRPAARSRILQRNEYLPSGKPMATNVLESLRDESQPANPAPYLPSSRLAKRSDQDRAESRQSYALSILGKNPIRGLPALSSRIRFHRSHKIGTVPTITASLELEIPPYALCEVDLLAVKIQLTRGEALEIGKEHNVQLPKTCRGRDNLTWLYTLSPSGSLDEINPSALPICPLEVDIEARANISDICRPLVKIRWKTNVDFNSAANTVRTPLPPPQQDSIRPLSQSQPQTQPRPRSDSGPGASTANDRPPSWSSLDAARPGTRSPEFTVTFIPPGRAYVGEPFKWSVTVMNRTAQARHLSLTALQRRKRQTGKRHSHQSSTGSVTAVSKSGAVADAHVDENLLYTTVKSSGPDVAHLVCADADVKVGPLAPGAAAAVELEFLPLVEGLLQVDAIRVMDLGSNEYCDVRQVPAIVAVARD